MRDPSGLKAAAVIIRPVPMMSGVEELDPGRRYLLDIGRIRVGPLSTGIACEVNVQRADDKAISFVSLPDQGNTDVTVCVELEPAEGGETRMTARLKVSPLKEVPEGAPIGIIERTTNAAMGRGLRKMLSKQKKLVESEAFNQVA